MCIITCTAYSTSHPDHNTPVYWKNNEKSVLSFPAVLPDLTLNSPLRHTQTPLRVCL